MAGGIDLTRPFIAICAVVQDPILEKLYQEYLVNPLDETLYRASVTTGGWFSMEHEVVNSSESSSPEVDVAPLSALPTIRCKMDEYDEFVLWWTLAYTNVSGDPIKLQFSAFKALRNAVTSDDIPVLRRAGFIVLNDDHKITNGNEEP